MPLYWPSPTFGEYGEWAERQGFIVEYGERYGTTFLKITPPEGASVVHFGLELEESMVPHIVSNLDRVLNVRSPWNPDNL